MQAVAYKSLDDAIRICPAEEAGCRLSKSDLSAAFRRFEMSKNCWRYLLLKAKSPNDGKTYYFVNKCLPFGAAISCLHFQRFSDALTHIVRWKNNITMQVDKPIVNYLDDFLFVILLALACNLQTQLFMEICEQINFPLSEDKMETATMRLVFLGLLVDTVKQMIMLPKEKLQKGITLLTEMLNKKSRKVTIHDLQKLCGFLNFLGKAVVPGRAFTRRLYAYTKSNILKPHHHVHFLGELHADMTMWLRFLY